MHSRDQSYTYVQEVSLIVLRFSRGKENGMRSTEHVCIKLH